MTSDGPHAVFGAADGTLRDPLWGLRLPLRPVERALLRSPLLTRLHGIRQAGAGWLTSGETGSRLQHTLGVVALTDRLAPGDHELRSAALLHDVGHLPLSHTLEGLRGLDHHALGRALVAAPSVRDTLAGAGLDPARVAALALGDEPSPLRPGGGRLGLDHLDGLVRCAVAHGWTDRAPGALLSAVSLRAGALEAAPAAADELARLLLANARWHVDPANVGPVAAVRRLVGALLDGGVEAAALAGWSDAQLWAALLAAPATRDGTRALLDAPWACGARPGDGPPGPGETVHTAAPAYLLRPARELSPAALAALDTITRLPRRFLVPG